MNFDIIASARAWFNKFVALLTAVLMLVGLGVMTAQAAYADTSNCDGLTLTGPEGGVKNPYDNLSYDLVVNNTAGRTITFDIDPGLALDESSLQAYENGPVKSYAYDKDSNKVTIVFKDDAQATQLALTTTVKPETKQNINSKTSYTSQIDGCDAVKNTTAVKGDVNYSPTKTAESAMGGTNRVVTYYFNAKTNDWSSDDKNMTNLTSHSQVFTDELPAGAVVTGHSDDNPNGLNGKWTNNGDTWTWTGSNVHGPSPSPLDTSERAIYLVVEYPADKFPSPDGTVRPPKNVVNLHTESKDGVDTHDDTAEAQGDNFADDSGSELIKIMKKMNNSSDTDANGSEAEDAYNGDYSSNASKGVVAASYDNGGKGSTHTLKNFVLTDDASRSTENGTFFNHANLYKVDVNFNSALRASVNTFTFEYKTSDAPSTWKSYDLGSNNTTTANSGRFFLRAVPSSSTSAWDFGSEGANAKLDLTHGTHLVGWRVTVTPAANTDIPSGSQITVKPQYVVSGLPLDTKDATTTDAEPTVTNTAEADGESDSGAKLTATDPTTINIKKAVPVYTQITTDGNINMADGAGKTTYRACVQNLDPHGTAYKTNMSVVLPEGMEYDTDPGATPTTAKADPTDILVPTVGNGLTIDSSKYVNANKQQVVNFQFADLKSTLTHDNAWTGSYCYTIPVKVTTQAFIAAQSKPVSASSWAWAVDDEYKNVPITPTWDSTVSGDDQYGLVDGAQNGKPATNSTSSNINIAGALNMTKQVSRDQDNPTWKLETPVDSPSKQAWQIQLLNSFSTDLNDAVVFDRLPFKGDANKSDFDVKMSGAATVTDAQGNAVDSNKAHVEYSKNATSATDGDWSETDFDGATAVKVTLPTLAKYQSFNVKLPTDIAEQTTNGAKAINGSSATFKYNNGQGSSDLDAKSNTAEIDVATGTFSVKKQVTGTDAAIADANKSTFTVNYTATLPDGTTQQGSVDIKNGQTSDPLSFPVNTKIHLDEVAPDAIDGDTWGTPSFDTNDFTITDAGKNVPVTLTNPNTQNPGSFTLVKKVTGEAAGLVSKDAEFKVDYTATLPDGSTKAGKLTVRNDGKVVDSPQFPAGTKVSLKEEAPADVATATWGDAKFDLAAFAIGGHKTLAVTLTNTITKNPVPNVTPSPSPSVKEPNHAGGNDLATTGAAIASIGIACGLLAAAAGALMAVRRKRQ